VEQAVIWSDHEALGQRSGPRSEFYERISRVSTGVLRDQLQLSGMPCPDQLAMAVALDPQTVIAEGLRVRTRVELEGQLGRGMMAVDWNRADGAPNVYLVTRVHQDVTLNMMQACL
jgi:inosine-uridine nucleoside N-ribohydrolase